MNHTVPGVLRNQEDLAQLKKLGFSKKLIRQGKVIFRSPPREELNGTEHKKQVKLELDCGLARVTETGYYIWVDKLQTF